MNANQLNEVADFLASNGIEVTKELVFSISIKTLVDAGLPVSEAVDAVLGAGKFEGIQQSVIDHLK